MQRVAILRVAPKCTAPPLVRKVSKCVQTGDPDEKPHPAVN
jgi:hypothetical protein